MVKKFITVSILFLFIAGCSQSSGGAGDGLFGDGSSDLSGNLTNDQQRFGDGSIPLAAAGSETGAFSDVYFDYDSAALNTSEREKIELTAEILNKDSTLQVEVEGHCDERGTSEYNLALGENRARKVAEELIKLGVNPSQLSTISYGEELPLDPNSFAKNRRAHFAVYRRPGN